MFENHKKVVINIASVASYVNILSGQKFIENAKNGQFGEVLKIEATSVNSYQTGNFK